jgi:hypothetical protein
MKSSKEVKEVKKSSLSSFFSFTNIFSIGLLITGAALIIRKK